MSGPISENWDAALLLRRSWRERIRSRPWQKWRKLRWPSGDETATLIYDSSTGDIISFHHPDLSMPDYPGDDEE